MDPDPIHEHLTTRTEAEIAWHIQFLANTRARLLRRAATPTKPTLTPEQVDLAVLKAERERDTYRLALMIIEAMYSGERALRERRASKCITPWSATFPGVRACEPLKNNPSTPTVR
ncbi:MAG: hypothetical protein ABI548_13565 [Polyangiaceae bacterium]